MIKRDSFQSSVATELVDYISLKQALGRRFEAQSIILLYLDRFLYKLEKPSPDLSAETFRQWCQSMESVSSTTKLARMSSAKLLWQPPPHSAWHEPAHDPKLSR